MFSGESATPMGLAVRGRFPRTDIANAVPSFQGFALTTAAVATRQPARVFVHLADENVRKQVIVILFVPEAAGAVPTLQISCRPNQTAAL